jgi:hypothetical protein
MEVSASKLFLGRSIGGGRARPPLAFPSSGTLDGPSRGVQDRDVVGGRSNIWTALVILASILAGASILLGLIVGAAADFDKSSDRGFWITFLVLSGILIFAGLWLINRSGWLGVALIIVGSILGSIAIFWSIIYPLVAIVVIALAILWVRREPAAPTAPTI